MDQAALDRRAGPAAARGGREARRAQLVQRCEDDPDKEREAVPRTLDQPHRPGDQLGAVDARGRHEADRGTLADREQMDRSRCDLYHQPTPCAAQLMPTRQPCEARVASRAQLCWACVCLQRASSRVAPTMRSRIGGTQQSSASYASSWRLRPNRLHCRFDVCGTAVCASVCV